MQCGTELLHGYRRQRAGKIPLPHFIHILHVEITHFQLAVKYGKSGCWQNEILPAHLYLPLRRAQW